MVGTQFIVEGQKSNTDSYSPSVSSSVPVDYGLQTGESKPLYGSDFVTKTQTNTEVESQQFFPTDNNNNLRPQLTPTSQLFNQRLPTQPGQFSVNENPSRTNQQQYPVGQNFNQNPHSVNVQGYVNTEQENIPLLNEQSNLGGSEFLLKPDSYRTPTNYDNSQKTQNSQFLMGQNNYGTPISNDNVQNTQNTYFKESETKNQPQNKIRFPFTNQNPQTGFNGYSNKNPVSSPSNINPNSWIKGQLKGKQMAGQSSFTNKQFVDNEFLTPNSQLNKPASTFDLGNREQIEHEEQTHIQNNNYGSLSFPAQSQTNFEQQSSVSNGQSYSATLSPSYSPLSKFNQPGQQQSTYLSNQDRPINGDSKNNKQFRIVVPDIPTPNNNGEQFYPQYTNPAEGSNSNRGSSSKQLKNYNSVRYPNKIENVGSIKNPSYTDSSQSPSQKSPISIPSATSSKCPNGFSGIKPHPTDCSKFLSCANGRTFEMDCGPGTLFNPTLSVCDHPNNVECNWNTVLTTTSNPTDNYVIPSAVENYYTTVTTPITVYDDYTTPIEDYPPIDARQDFDHDTSSSDLITETQPLENNQAVLETLPTENRQLKILKNPSSIDLSDNFLLNSSTIIPPILPKVFNNQLDNVAVRIDLKPNSTQSIRLRGGPKNSEGFLQVQEKPFQWGVVCDAPNLWTIDKADVVCKQLGFYRYLNVIIHFGMYILYLF